MTLYSLKDFLYHVNAICDARPVYDTGGLSRTRLDCVGLPMLAIIELGRKPYDMHSSNYFARYQTNELEDVSSVDDLNLGDLVYKWRAPSDSGYDLSDTYLTGRYNTGDDRDYYHIGVVTGINPLKIRHVTSSAGCNGAKVDTKIGNWRCHGKIKGVDYTNYIEEADGMTYENGTPAKINTGKTGTTTWNLRSDPSIADDNVIAKVPFGVAVTVYETADGWGQVEYNGNRGYMKTEAFTVAATGAAATNSEGTVTITLTTSQVEAVKSIAAML